MIAVMLMSVALIAGLYVLAYTLAVYALPVSPDAIATNATLSTAPGTQDSTTVANSCPSSHAARRSALLHCWGHLTFAMVISLTISRAIDDTHLNIKTVVR
ncbi:hypothetical protein [Agrobacterium tumefaciens]|uniref:hypothetical protein n=1 Tax=Agrobacterium tumefaciens TaxID=358 RepID=UPI00157457FB|nr:hypothetical protein [Agrobacterium tumefaciens]WCK21743.1 hypothetical protein G6M09_022420 [Agrobacterium tumefaciens]